MGLIGGIIGGVVGTGAQLIAGKKASKLIKKNQALMQQRSNENKNWYEREYNSDYTQRADAQAALNNARDVLNQKYQQAQGASAVSGASDASVALQKQAANATLGDTTRGIAAEADKYKSSVRNQFVSQQSNLDNQLMNSRTQQANNIVQQGKAVADSANKIGGLF